MSSIAISGDTSGAVTLSVPAVAGTSVVTIAAQTGTLNAAGPAFRGYSAGTQTISNTTYTKVTLTEDFDTNNNFASGTFTPTVAGYYQITGICTLTAGTSLSNVTSAIYRNGTLYSQLYGASYTSTAAGILNADLIYFNGTTDYVELYIRGNGSGTLTVNAATYFSGCLVRGA